MISGLFSGPGRSECPVPSVQGLVALNSKGRDFWEALRGWSTAPLLLLRSGFTPLLLGQLWEQELLSPVPCPFDPRGSLTTEQ